MGDNLTQKTFKGFFWQFGGTVFRYLVQLGVLIILARLISKADFGIVQSALVVVGMSKLLSQMGVGPALVQRKSITSLHIRAGFTLSVILSALFFLLVYFSAGLIADFFNMPPLIPVLKVVAALFIVEGLTTVSNALLLRDMKQKTLVQIGFISYTVGYGAVASTLAIYGFGLWALIIGQLAQSVLRCILSYVKSRHSVLPFWGREEIKDLLYFGGGFTLAKFFNYLANQGANIITGRYLGAGSLGVYGRAYALMVKPVRLIGRSVDKALFPAMSVRQNKPKRLIEAFINGSKMIAFICIPLSFLIFFSAEEIVHVILGPQWDAAIIPLQILTAGLVFRIGYKMGDCLCRATGKVYRRAKRQFVYAVCVIVGCYVGANWGIVGVAAGAVFSVAMNYILMIHLSLAILNIKWSYFLKRTFAELPIAVLLGLIFIGIISLTRLWTASDFLILLISYSVYGGVVVFLFYHFSQKLSFLTVLPFQKTLQRLTKTQP